MLTHVACLSDIVYLVLLQFACVACGSSLRNCDK